MGAARLNPASTADPRDSTLSFGYNINKMSHSVTITRTTTTSTSTAILVNTGFLKTAPGILKLFEVLLAATCLFLTLFYTYRRYVYDHSVYEFYFATITTVLVASGCILISCLLSLSTASILTKTLFELVYHCVAFALTFASSLVFYFDVKHQKNSVLMGAILGLVLSILFLISSVFAFRSYRGFCQLDCLSEQTIAVLRPDVQRCQFSAIAYYCSSTHKADLQF
ncbi:hypothetical protein GE061_018180 [Apolygus lucorum]|uniref:MARVEL domain-containing protein n=1 Tax=Apolygus lucorum TaxID=248454 RepID=A0A8S9XEJ2_APOLU|nr:hypothetical protein GE061_018180 [Apolygus lucorum]